MTIELRVARPDEYAEVGLLSEEGYRVEGYLERPDGPDEGYGRTLRDAATRAEQAELIVAVDGDEILGTLTWCAVLSPLREIATRDNQGEFRMLAVSPNARRRGVGATLVQWCIDRATGDGLNEIVMCSMQEMRPAHALYERFGFERLPEKDWEPVPGVKLLGFRRDIAASNSR